ncbi:MAG: HAD family hydrolase, partial [Thermodesulfobacteriota bacterium]|nr:HAD family hydrolase [Thermodesulfobacteriota bacterium]
MTSEILGVSQEAWNEQLLEKSRQRLIGEVNDPTVMIRTMAHAIDPTIPEEVISTAVKNRIEMFARALKNIPEKTSRTLSELKTLGKKIGLISNADESEIAAWDRSPIAHLFDSTIFSCRVGCAKPEPGIYRLCMQELGVTSHQCLFVGDGGSHELEGAKDLQITTVMMTGIISELWPDRIDERRLYADYVIDQLSELLLE